MNPPFTRNDIRNRQYNTRNRRSLQEREIEIAKFLERPATVPHSTPSTRPALEPSSRRWQTYS